MEYLATNEFHLTSALKGQKPQPGSISPWNNIQIHFQPLWQSRILKPQRAKGIIRPYTNMCDKVWIHPGGVIYIYIYTFNTFIHELSLYEVLCLHLSDCNPWCWDDFPWESLHAVILSPCRHNYELVLPESSNQVVFVPKEICFSGVGREKGKSKYQTRCHSGGQEQIMHLIM